MALLPTWAPVCAYDGLYLLKAACEIANTTTDREAINNALYEISELEGAISTYTYLGDHNLNTSLYVTRNEDGLAVMIDKITCIGISYFSISSGMCFHRCFVETRSNLTACISALCAALQPLSNGIRQTVFYCCLHSIHILFMFMLYDKG